MLAWSEYVRILMAVMVSSNVGPWSAHPGKLKAETQSIDVHANPQGDACAWLGLSTMPLSPAFLWLHQILLKTSRVPCWYLASGLSHTCQPG